MQAGSLLVGLSLALIAAVAIADPLQRARRGTNPGRGVRRIPARDRRQRALLAIRDLDFDFHTGKLEEEDYLQLRRQLMADAARLTEAAGGVGAGTVSVIDPLPGTPPSPDTEIVLCQSCGQEGQPGDRYCSRCGTRVARQCSACGADIGPEDRFCAGCGGRANLGPEG